MPVVPVRAHAWASDFDKLAEQLWAMMSEMEGPNYFRSHAPHTWRPPLNLYEIPGGYAVCVELAGMAREAIDVRAADGVLHICGVRAKAYPSRQSPQRQRARHGDRLGTVSSQGADTRRRNH